MDAFEHDYLGRAGALRRWTLAQATERLPSVDITPRSVPIYRHGSLLLKLFSPHRTDPQQPHTRDEVYLVAQGRGWFVNGGLRHAFGPGDVLFVPAGVVHRFEDFSDDLTLWVVFYGPEGGEKP
jgi:mannose-6-phosphate isomerase-like protein (cupin superfamily)